MTSPRPLPVLRPQFIPGTAGRLFVNHFSPAEPDPKRHAVLLIPPFADEMNKSRRMFSMLARSLASQGMDCCLIDLYGTGDSEGNFADADWDIWCRDVQIAHSWLVQQGIMNISLLGMRTGALLASDVAQRRMFTLDKLVFWQPVVDGETFLNQFLRLRLAADMLNTKSKKSTSESLRQSLMRGECVEVAGYMLPPALAQELASKKLVEMDVSHLGQISWFDVSSHEGASLSQSSQTVVERWQSLGVKVKPSVVTGSSFWMTAEITEVPGLIVASTECLLGVGG